MSIALFALWLILNARIAWDVVLTGLAATAAVLLFMWKFLNWTPTREACVLRSIPLAILYLLRLIREIVTANLYVMRVIRTGKPEPVIRSFHTKLQTRFARTILANSITITPGTVTLACEGDCLTVHCLMPELADSLENSVLERRLLRLEGKLHG